jgi:hypothetical protein
MGAVAIGRLYFERPREAGFKKRLGAVIGIPNDRLFLATCCYAGEMSKRKSPESLPINPLTLKCPFCEVGPGQDCATSSGGFSRGARGTHQGSRRP